MYAKWSNGPFMLEFFECGERVCCFAMLFDCDWVCMLGWYHHAIALCFITSDTLLYGIACLNWPNNSKVIALGCFFCSFTLLCIISNFLNLMSSNTDLSMFWRLYFYVDAIHSFMCKCAFLHIFILIYPRWLFQSINEFHQMLNVFTNRKVGAPFHFSMPLTLYASCNFMYIVPMQRNGREKRELHCSCS